MNDFNRFRGTAKFYSRYRLPYPQTFFEDMAKKFCLDGTGRLLDLGCGTGQIAIPFAPFFREVVAIDPEPEMLTEAQKQAVVQEQSAITWVLAASRDLMRLQDRLGRFQVVTIGNAFHWMEKERTLRALYPMVVSHGGVIIVTNDIGIYRTKQEWGKIARQILEKWLGGHRPAHDEYLKSPQEYIESALLKSPFEYDGSPINHEYQIQLTIEQIIGLLLSKSYSSTVVFGKRLPSFIEELIEALLEVNAIGVFSDIVNLTAYIGMRR